MNSTKNASSAQARRKTQPEEFDLVILGGGTGSTIAAWTFAGEGKQVAVVDRKYIGGVWPNIPGLPSKNNIPNAKIAALFLRSKECCVTKRGLRVDKGGGGGRQRRGGGWVGDY